MAQPHVWLERVFIGACDLISRATCAVLCVLCGGEGEDKTKEADE